MDALLTIPLILIPLVLAFSKYGALYRLHYIICYIYFTIRSRLIRKRFDLYDYRAEGHPERNGFFAAKEEWTLETPQYKSDLVKNSDNVFVFGSNSKSEYLAVNISRKQNSFVQCNVLLQTNGKQYTLPEEHIMQRATSEENTFGSSRLKVQCLIPMRKWRIFFNGLLQERDIIEDKSQCNTLKQVKFSFIWTASSEVFDFYSDISKHQICHSLSRSACLNWPIFLWKKLIKLFDAYDHPGMLLGTMRVEGTPEFEMYLWGCRRRFIGKDHGFRQGNCIELYSNMKNGSLIHLGLLTDSGIVNRILYGYIMKPNGFIHPIGKIEGDVENLEKEKKFRVYSDGNWNDITISNIGKNIKFQKELIEKSFIRTAEIIANDIEGKGIILKGYAGDVDDMEKLIKRRKTLSMHITSKEHNFCISFKDANCQKSELCGGKGSSLGNLYSVSLLTRSNNQNCQFVVPNGVVVTTDAYYEFIKGKLKNMLENFQKNIYLGKEDKEQLCTKMMKEVEETNLPENLSKIIIKELKSEFSEDLSNYKFAVRSSATGEDTEQMSAAGQMETFLGVKGEDEILSAVKKCWASQFSFQAVEYKRGYGQIINSPMAVVIQVMVPCDVAGVIFTCDPVTGHPSYVNITANLGLGESVVSASAEPDTVSLKRTIEGHLTVHDVQIGHKKTKIIMDGSIGTKEVPIEDQESQICCIDNETSLRLGKIAHEVETHYGSPRDIEWGILSGNIYLFQCRPVTSIDQESDFETIHIFDNYLRTEREFNTKANVGEVMPGATSPLGIDILQKLLMQCEPRRFVGFSFGAYPLKPYFQKGLVSAYSHIFINLIGGFMGFEDSREEETNASIIGLFGRIIDTTEIKKSSIGRNPKLPKGPKLLIIIIYMVTMMYISGLSVQIQAYFLKKKKVTCKGMTSIRALQEIGRNYEISADGMLAHMNCSFSSSHWNMAMLSLLSKAKGGWDNDVFSDFAYLLSTCNDVESANIPSSLQDIGVLMSKEINSDEFKKMTEEDILVWLKKSNSKAGMKFRQFIERHGHRCLKEFDVFTETWETNPKPALEMLKNFVDNPTNEHTVKETPTFDAISSKLQVDLGGFKNRFRLGHWLLPNARRGVRNREYSKSLSIWTINVLRKPLYTLSEIMVEEGRLPRKELMFFLCVDEIHELIKTRSPRLVAKAIRRERFHDKLDRLAFPEICDGIPKPTEEENIEYSGKGFKMTGVPVSQGVVKATARVVMTLKEAKTIQKGDVLITYSTDIGWSPYFPLLSGVVTELGGLISHGAVVAREFGLPCVVSLHGATRAFKSGDTVILDGGNGTLQRVDEE